jgi:PAS domain S-box-containing protein
MFKGESAEVTQFLETANKERYLGISVLGPNGKPAFGTQADPSLRELSKRGSSAVIKGHKLIFYKPLSNEQRCHNCHSPLDATRGAIITTHSMEKVDGEIRKTALRILLLAIFLGITSEIFLLVVLRKWILRPLATLTRGAELLEEGRLDHRIEIQSNDEVGALASCFNQMAESIEKSHAHLEHEVRQKTKEMRVTAELSTRVFKGDLSFVAIAEQFLDAIKDSMGYDFAGLCLVDKETGVLSQEVRRGLETTLCFDGMSLANSHPFTRCVRLARPAVKQSAEIGLPWPSGKVVIIPLLSHQRKRCWEINLCTLGNCPAFSSDEERCWLVADTLCKSPQAVAGRDKIYGCLHCTSFPVLGVLVAGTKGEIRKSSVHTLEILASELASAIENQRFIESKTEDINKLIKLHDVLVESFQDLGGALSRSIVSSAALFSETDAAVLWLLNKDRILYPEDSFNLKKEAIPASLSVDTPFPGRAIRGQEILETVDVAAAECLDEIIRSGDFLYVAAVPLKAKDATVGCLTLFKRQDFFMTASQKAIVSLFAGQAAAALNTARIYQALQESEGRYRSFIEGAIDVIFTLSEGGLITSLSPSFETITGWTRGEWIGRHFSQLLHPDDVDVATEMLQRILKGERPPSFELSARARGGNYVIAEFTGTSHVRDGKRIGIFGIARDVTERKKSNENLKRLMQELSLEKDFSDAILDSTESGIAVLDRKGRLLRVNRAGAEVLEIEADKAVGMSIAEIDPVLGKLAVAGRSLNNEVTLTTNGGVEKPIGFSTSPLRDADARETGTIVVFRDLRDIKKLQNELRKKEHFESMGKVISGVAHEIRNPLFGISSIGQILERELETAPHKVLIQAMLKEAGRMRRLIDELLLYTRPARLDIREINMADLLAEMHLYARAKSETIASSIHVPPLLTVRGDRDKIIQVFLNLLNNAIDAAKTSISISAGKTPGGMVEIEVTDDGAGISREDIAKVFEPFFTTKKGGTGLGLPICRKIMEDHGGAISIRSSAAEGTTVTLSFRE